MRPWQSHREQGRQITDGGKQRAAPGHGVHNKPPLSERGGQEVDKAIISTIVALMPRVVPNVPQCASALLTVEGG